MILPYFWGPGGPDIVVKPMELESSGEPFEGSSVGLLRLFFFVFFGRCSDFIVSKKQVQGPGPLKYPLLHNTHHQNEDHKIK